MLKSALVDDANKIDKVQNPMTKISYYNIFIYAKFFCGLPFLFAFNKNDLRKHINASSIDIMI